MRYSLRRNGSRLLLPGFALLLAGAAPLSAEETQFITGAATLAQQIVETYQPGKAAGKTRIAVMEFSDLDGQVSDFGRLLSEELITRLFLTGRFEVVERLLLGKIIKEHKLQLTSIVDPESAKQLGKIAGVDAIVSGTCSDIGTGIRVNARIISTETGSVAAVASATIGKDAAAERLSQPQRGDSDATASQPAGILYKADFQTVTEGEAPSGWEGCDRTMVKRAAGKSSYWTNFGSAGNFWGSTPSFRFANDMEIELRHYFGDHCCEQEWGHGRGSTNLGVEVAGLSMVFNMEGRVTVNGAVSSVGGVIQDRIMHARIMKHGDVWRIELNGREVYMGRHPSQQVEGRMTFRINSQLNWRLSDLVVRAL